MRVFLIDPTDDAENILKFHTKLAAWSVNWDILSHFSRSFAICSGKCTVQNAQDSEVSQTSVDITSLISLLRNRFIVT